MLNWIQDFNPLSSLNKVTRVLNSWVLLSELPGALHEGDLHTITSLKS